MTRKFNRSGKFIFGVVTVVFLFLAGRAKADDTPLCGIGSEPVVRSDTEWKESLDPLTYHVTRRKGTEAAFTGKYVYNRKKGMYLCSSCQAPLFSSETKFDSHTGWPSFWAPVSGDHVEFKKDDSLGIVRTEVICRKCQAHLGHVFDDGPDPTGERYCINSVALTFEKKSEYDTPDTKIRNSQTR